MANLLYFDTSKSGILKSGFLDFHHYTGVNKMIFKSLNVKWPDLVLAWSMEDSEKYISPLVL